MDWLYRRALSALIAWGGMAGAAAQTACPPAPQPFTPELFAQAAPHARDRGLLWTVSRNGRTSYLYGTMHVGRAEWMAPGPAVRQALQATELLALELDPLDESIQREVMAAGAAVQRKLSPRTTGRLQAAWKAACFPETDLTQGAPEMHVIGLMVSLALRDGVSPLYGSEILLSLTARGLGRTVVSLETAALQLQALMSGDDRESEAFVADTLDDMERGKTRQVLLKTVQVWERSDIAELERYTQWCECVDTEAERRLMKRLLQDRNPGLAERIDGLHMQGKTVLAAVGAMHMVGRDGLVALLGLRGYAVKRVH